MMLEDFVYVVEIIIPAEEPDCVDKYGYLNRCDEFTQDIYTAVMSTDKSYIKYLLDEQKAKHLLWEFSLLTVKCSLEVVEVEVEE